MIIRLISMAFLTCHCSSGFELGRFIINVASGIHSAYTKLPAQPTGLEMSGNGGIPKIGVGLAGQRDWTDAQLCAAELAYKLSTSLVADDEFSQRSSFTAGNWRDPGSAVSHIPLDIGCVAEGYDRRKAKIVCRGQVRGPWSNGSGIPSLTGEDGAKQEVFARYWTYFPEADSEDGKMSREYERRVDSLTAFADLPNDGPLASQFNNGHGIRLFSPFHPDDSHFDVHFRSRDRQSVCRLVLDTRPEVSLAKRASRDLDIPQIAIEKLATTHPILFHRLTSDIFHPIPLGLPSVSPRSVESIGHVRGHLERLAEFVDLFRYLQHSGTWEVTEDETNGCKADGFMAQPPMIIFADRVKRCILDAQIALIGSKSNPFYRCDEGLPVWSRHPLCPPTSACYDSGMCSRMLACGNGLWLDVRGQNTLEATSRVVKQYTPEVFVESLTPYAPDVYEMDESTKTFYAFPLKDRNLQDDGGVVWQKMHVSKGRAAMFIVLFHHQPSDRSGMPSFIYSRKEDLAALRRPFSSSESIDAETLEERIDQFASSQGKTSRTTMQHMERKKQANVPMIPEDMNETFFASLSFSSHSSDSNEVSYTAKKANEKGEVKPTDQKYEITFEHVLYFCRAKTYLYQQEDGSSTVIVSTASPAKTIKQRTSKEDEADFSDFALIENSPDTSRGVLRIATSPSPNPFKKSPEPSQRQPSSSLRQSTTVPRQTKSQAESTGTSPRLPPLSSNQADAVSASQQINVSKSFSQALFQENYQKK